MVQGYVYVLLHLKSSAAHAFQKSRKSVLWLSFYPQQLSPNVSSAHLNSIIIYIRRRMLEED